MFLNQLNQQEGMAFINLLSQFAMADEVIRKEEQYLMNKSFKEMSLDKNSISKMTYNEAKDIICQSSQKVINIVYFELMRMALIDGEYEIEEVEFLEKLGIEFKISRSKKFQLANFFYNNFDINDDSDKVLEEAKKVVLE